MRCRYTHCRGRNATGTDLRQGRGKAHSVLAVSGRLFPWIKDAAAVPADTGLRLPTPCAGHNWSPMTMKKNIARTLVAALLGTLCVSA